MRKLVLGALVTTMAMAGSVPTRAAPPWFYGGVLGLGVLGIWEHYHAPRYYASPPPVYYYPQGTYYAVPPTYYAPPQTYTYTYYYDYRCGCYR